MNWSAFLAVIGIGSFVASFYCELKGKTPIPIGTPLLFGFGLICLAIAIGLARA